MANTWIFLTASGAGASVCREGSIASDPFLSCVCWVKPCWDNGMGFSLVRDPAWIVFDRLSHSLVWLCVWHEYLFFLALVFPQFFFFLLKFELLWKQSTRDYLVESSLGVLADSGVADCLWFCGVSMGSNLVIVELAGLSSPFFSLVPPCFVGWHGSVSWGEGCSS